MEHTTVFFAFLWHLWSNLWWFFTSGPLVIEPMLDYFIDGYEGWVSQFISRQRRRRLYYGLSVVGIFIASFLAFSDVYTQVQMVQKTLQDRGISTEQRANILELQKAKKDLEARLASTQQEVNRLHSRLAWRDIDEATTFRIVQALKATTPHEVFVTALMGNDESINFATKLITILRDGGWKVPGTRKPPLSIAMMSGSIFGLHFRIKPNSPIPDELRVLGQILEANNMKVDREVTFDSTLKNPDDIGLLVGSTPSIAGP